VTQIYSILETDQGIRIELIKLQLREKQISPSLESLLLKWKLRIQSIGKKYSKYYKLPGLKTWKYSKINLYFGDLACWFKNTKKYLPVVESAVKEGKTLASNLAVLKDRITLREGGKQIYGSQGLDR